MNINDADVIFECCIMLHFFKENEQNATHDCILNTRSERIDILNNIIRNTQLSPFGGIDHDLNRTNQCFREQFNKIQFKNELIKNALATLLKDDFKCDKIIKHDNKEINYATAVIIALLHVYEENVACVTSFAATKINIEIQDINNTAELKLIVNAGIFSVINFDLIPKINYTRRACLDNMKLFMNDYYNDYKVEIKNTLQIFIPRDVIDILCTYIVVN